jgi:hypothetical protein
MASFTDQIMQFNPYVQQLPVEAMAKVGMYKQQKYEEGVQKIQSYIDNVAGLDVVRDVDKKYLQSKLDELGGKLKSVAAGDFSNFQLVNSVGGMATQIAKDPTVQNAVQSTAWYRKQIGEMDKAISEGKSSIENQWDFNEKANNWFSSTDLNKSFKDRYTPYTDVKKKAMEAIKSLHPKLNQYEIPFKINDDGTIDTKQIADAMKRYKIEGIDEGQIKAAVTASLDQNDLNQLSISGRYRFRGITPEQLVKKAQDTYDLQKKSAVETLNYLMEQKRIVTDPSEGNKIDAQIDYYQTLLGKNGAPGLLDESLKSNVENAQKDPDQVKASLYTDGFVKEFANAFTWKNQVMSYETNPIRQQLNFVEKMKFDQQVENRRRYEFKENLKREDEKIRISAEANALKKAELYGDPASNDWTPLGNPTDNELKAQEHFTKHVSSVGDAVNSDIARLKTKYTDAQINDMLADWEENTTKATKVKPDALKLIQNISRNKNYLASLEEKQTQLMNSAISEVSKDPNYLAKIKESQDVLSGLDKRTSQFAKLKVGDKSINVTPSQVVKDIQSGIAKLSVDRAAGGDIRLTYNIDGKPNTITMSKKTLSFGADVVGGKEMRPVLLAVNDYLNKYGGVQKDYEKAIDKKYKEKLAPLAQEFVPQIKAVATGKNGEPPPIILSRLSQLITSADFNEIAADENFNTTKASTMLLEENKKDTRVFIEQDGDNFRVHLKSESDPSNRQILKLSRNDVVRYFGPGYVNDKTQESIRINVGRGNTNLTADPKKAMMQKQFGDFPGISKYQVTADLNQDLSDPNLYTAMINVKKKGGGYTTFEIAGNNMLQRVGFDQGRKNLNALTDLTLLKLLKESNPGYDFSNLDY